MYTSLDDRGVAVIPGKRLTTEEVAIICPRQETKLNAAEASEILAHVGKKLENFKKGEAIVTALAQESGSYYQIIWKDTDGTLWLYTGTPEPLEEIESESD